MPDPKASHCDGQSGFRGFGGRFGNGKRRGVGKSLLKYLAATMPEASPKLPALNVDGNDKGMQAFFEAVGFNHLIDQYEMNREL